MDPKALESNGPVQDPQRENPYSYARGSPEVFVDPSGRTPEPIDPNRYDVHVSAPTVRGMDRGRMSSDSRPLGSFLPGTQAGQEAAERYAAVYGSTRWTRQPMTKFGAGAGGVFASLWTPDTAVATALTLGSGLAAAYSPVTAGSRNIGFFSESRAFSTVRSLYSKASGGLRARGMSLDHMIPQRWAASRGGVIPDRLVNAGWNLLEISGRTNSLMSPAARAAMGGMRGIYYTALRRIISIGVPLSFPAAAYVGAKVGLALQNRGEA